MGTRYAIPRKIIGSPQAIEAEYDAISRCRALTDEESQRLADAIYKQRLGAQERSRRWLAAQAEMNSAALLAAAREDYQLAELVQAELNRPSLLKERDE